MRAQEPAEPADRTARTPHGNERSGREQQAHGAGTAAAPPAAQMIALQRSAGNAAVSRLVQSRRQQDIQREPEAGAEMAATDGVQRSVQDTLRSSGRPLDGPVRREMEARLGADFSSVRVHADAAAQRSAADIGARAYTSGEHVVVGSGSADKHVLAHELTHVIQQRQGPVAGTDNGSGVRVSDPSDRFERAAEANARRVMSGPAPTGGRGHADAGGRAGTGGQAQAHGHSAVHRMLAGDGVQRMNAAGGQQQAPAPAPVLTGVHLAAADEEGRVGNFARVRQWQVANPQQGVIIQHVTRVFNVDVLVNNNWQPLTGAALDAYVTDPNSSVHATVLQYWELWTVDANGNVSDGGEDTFGLPSIVPNARKLRDTTQGTFAITGTANFYPTAVAPATLGFTRGLASSVAGGLFMRLTDPATDLAANGVVAAGQPVAFTATSTWDSTGATGANAASMYSTVTP